jgi:amidase
VKKVPIKDGKAIFNQFELPLNPMIGVIGVAPENQPIPCGTPGRHGGNMDNTKIAKGATLYLPIFHDGAYFGCGDVHACMGDGEIMVSGVEIGAVVSVRLTVLKGVSIDNPRLEDAENIYTIASSEDIEKAIYTATKDMCSILQKNLGYTLNEAGMLMSAAGNLQFCQVVDPERTVRMAIPKTICDKVL